jgi:hypothetical protein
MILGYGRLRPPSRLSASLRPLRRRCAALTAILSGQDNVTIRAKKEKRKTALSGDGQYHRERRLHKNAHTSDSQP